MPEVRSCGNCGQPTSADARFCPNCGHRLVIDDAGDSTELHLGLRIRLAARRALAPDEAAAVAALPLRSAFLICQRGAGAGSRYLLDADRVTVGRHPDNDICLEDITVSRRHLELLRENHRYYVHDLASLNGTYLNHERVDLAVLDDGDEIRIGAFQLLFFGSPHRPLEGSADG